MAGNRVILKPAPVTILAGWQLYNTLRGVGIPLAALQFIPTIDNAAGQSLATHDPIDAVILAGAYVTGQPFQSWKPSF